METDEVGVQTNQHEPSNTEVLEVVNKIGQDVDGLIIAVIGLLMVVVVIGGGLAYMVHGITTSPDSEIVRQEMCRRAADEAVKSLNDSQLARENRLRDLQMEVISQCVVGKGVPVYVGNGSIDCRKAGN